MIKFETLQQYRDFFASIPEEKWTIGTFRTHRGQCCAHGHLLGPDELPNFSEHIESLLGDYRGTILADANDGYPDYRHLGSSPKERVLALLDLRIRTQQEFPE